MASEDVLPFSELLAPIPGENPAGTDLRANHAPDSDFRTIRRARDAAGEAERQIDRGDTEVEPPQWEPVVRLATGVLASKSKDLDVTAYLIEGLVRVHGFAGIRDGFRLARELVVQFWDGLYPSADGLEVSDRFSKIIYLNGIEKEGTIIGAIRKIPFTPPGDDHQFSLASYLQAQATAQPAGKKGGETVSTLDLIKQAVKEAEPGYFPNLVEEIEQARKEFLAFCEAFKERSKFDPPSSMLAGTLQAHLDMVKQLAKEKLIRPAAAVAAAPAEAVDGAAEPAAADAAAQAPGVVRTRQDALQQLEKVAEYFREKEPQSVIPFALEQVIKWGNMSLPDLLAELIPEEGPRKNLFKQVGIRPPTP